MVGGGLILGDIAGSFSGKIRDGEQKPLWIIEFWVTSYIRTMGGGFTWPLKNFF